jgi:hypothetical protein
METAFHIKHSIQHLLRAKSETFTLQMQNPICKDSYKHASGGWYEVWTHTSENHHVSMVQGEKTALKDGRGFQLDFAAVLSLDLPLL